MVRCIAFHTAVLDNSITIEMEKEAMSSMKGNLHTHNIIIGLAFGILLTGCGRSDSPEDAAEDFLSLLKNGQHLEAQDRLSSDFRQMAVGFAGGVRDENLKPYYRSASLSSRNARNAWV